MKLYPYTFLLQPVRENDYIEKKKSIVTELYETEKSFLLVLQTIAVVS